MRRKQTGNSTLGAVMSIAMAFLIIFGFFAFLMFVDAWKCSNRWADSGMQSRWTLGGGCQVQRPNGTWVPEKLLREVTP